MRSNPQKTTDLVTFTEEIRTGKTSILVQCETWPLTERLAEKVNSCEMRMLRHCLQKSLLEHQSNEEIRRKAKVMAILDLMSKRKLQ